MEQNNLEDQKNLKKNKKNRMGEMCIPNKGLNPN